MYDRGALPDATPADRMQLVLKRSDAQEAELRQLIEQQHAAASPTFHQWLQPAEFARRFGPADSDVEQVKAWLQAKGFTVNGVSRGKVTIEFSGTAGQVKTAFHTEMHTYDQDGVIYHSNNSDPEIPTALAPVIAGFASLNDIKPVSNSLIKGTAMMDAKTHASHPNWNAAEQCSTYSNGAFINYECTYYPPTPADLAVQYNVNPVYQAGTTGKGVTIGVISDSNIDLAIVQNYRSLFGFANTNNLPQVIVDGLDPGQNSDKVEAYLDVEAAAAMAPDATTNFYTSASTLTTSGLINAIIRSIDDDAADVLTVSYGQCEQTLGAAGNQFFYQAWQQAVAQGQSVFVSAGDGGSAGCDNFNRVSHASLGLAVNGFASTPFTTAVGGTDFYYPKWAEGKTGYDVITELSAAWGNGTNTNPQASLVAQLPEQVWNDGYGMNIRNSSLGNSIVGGSGGASSCAVGSGADATTGGYVACTGGYPKPSWQVGKGVPADGVRDLPDLSLFAADSGNLSFWPICADNYDCLSAASASGYSIRVTAVGGTSASAPAVAGIMALIDQSQKGRQGNANYNLYAIAAQSPNAFNDVTLGSNNVPCTKGTPNCSLDTNGDGFYTLQSYSATPGYDQASGLGTLNVANLIAAWGKITYTPTATTLSLSSTTSTHGTPLTITTGVTATSGTPTGTVAVTTTSAIPGQTGEAAVVLTNGTGSASLDFLPGGTYTVAGTYAGDGVYGASTSSPVSLTVAPEASTLTLVASDYNTNIYPATVTTLAANGTISYLDNLILDVTVAGKSGTGIPTGPVTFSDGGKTIFTTTINASGVAEFFGSLPAGNHTITATYAGDPSYNTSTSTSFPVTVSQAAPKVYSSYSVTYVKGVQSIYTGLPFVVTAKVTGGSTSAAPTGTVTISMGPGITQTATLVSQYANQLIGFASATFTPTVPGKYVIAVTYGGDANYTAGASNTTYSTVTVIAPTLAPTTTSITTSTPSVGPNGVYTLSSTVLGSIPGTIPTGTVYFYFGGFQYGVALDANGNGYATLASTDLVNGVNKIYARYVGDKNYAQSTSSTITVVANIGDYTLTTLNPSLAVKSGSSGTTMLSVADMALSTTSGLSGPVKFACTPSSAAITCNLAPSTVSLPSDGSLASTTLSVNTHVPLVAGLSTHATKRGERVLAAEAGLAVLLLLLPVRRKRLASLLILVLMTSVGLGLSGCSGNGSSGNGNSGNASFGNAAPGAYTVTVVANASGVQHSSLIKVTVQ